MRSHMPEEFLANSCKFSLAIDSPHCTMARSSKANVRQILLDMASAVWEICASANAGVAPSSWSRP